MWANIVILWLVVGVIENVAFTRKIIRDGFVWETMDFDAKIGFIIWTVLAIFLPPVFWGFIIAFNRINYNKWSLLLSMPPRA